jgi:putative MATE family efflux protein
MIGRLGTVEIAAVGLGNQVFFLFQLTLFGICSGGAIFTAQFWGRKDISGIRKNLGLCLTLALIVAAIYSFAAAFFSGELISIYSKDEAVIKAGAVYLKTLSPCFIVFGIGFVFTSALRSIERVRLAMITTVIALTLNLVMNYLFIFGFGAIPAMGVKGAALATVISRFIETVILVAVTYKKKYAAAGSIAELFSFDPGYVRHFFRVTLPVIANEMLWSLGITVQNLIFARTTTDAIAAFNITSTVSNLAWVLFMGLANGIAVLIGKKIGEGDEKAAKAYASRTAVLAPLLAVGASLLIFLISRLTPFVFNVNPETIHAASQMFIILCFIYPFRTFNATMIVGVCRAGGDTVFAVFYDVGVLWLIALPLGALSAFVLKAPVWTIYMAIAMDDLLKTAFGIRRLKSGRWLHNVIG